MFPQIFSFHFCGLEPVTVSITDRDAEINGANPLITTFNTNTNSFIVFCFVFRLLKIVFFENNNIK